MYICYWLCIVSTWSCSQKYTTIASVKPWLLACVELFTVSLGENVTWPVSSLHFVFIAPHLSKAILGTLLILPCTLRGRSFAFAIRFIIRGLPMPVHFLNICVGRR